MKSKTELAASESPLLSENIIVKIEGDTLVMADVESEDLDAYCVKWADNYPVYFIFIAEIAHVITLEEGEKLFVRVETRNEKIDVRFLDEEEVHKAALELGIAGD